MVDATAGASSPSSRSPVAAVAALRAKVAALPWRLFAFAYAFNFLTSLPFLIDTSSGTRSAWWSFPIDDSWIHLNYVRGLATEGCLCYNPGVWEAGTTSWGWVFLLAPFYLVGHVWLGFDPVIVVKLVGIGLGAITTLLVYYIAFRVTGSRAASMIIAAFVSVEPAWVFLRLSGMEGALVTPVVLGSAVAMFNRRWAATGLLLGAAFWARPEVGIYVAVAGVTFIAYWFVTWEQRGALAAAVRALMTTRPGEELRRLGLTGATGSLPLLAGTRPVLLVAGIPMAALVMWVAYNLSVNGHIYPNTYLAKNDPTLGLLPVDNIRIAWERGFADFQDWVDGWRLYVASALALVGAVAIFRREGILSLGLILFMPLLLYAVSSGIRFGDAGFNFFARRYTDPAVPILLMLTLIGGWLFISWIRRFAVGRFSLFSSRVILLAPLYGLMGFYFFTSASGQFATHSKLTEDFSWNARNVFDEDELAGLWLKRHAPAGSSVLIADAGAIRYFSELYTNDGVGLNTHENIGRPTMQIVIDSKPDFIAIWEDGVWDSLPNATKVARFDTPRNTILGGGPVGIYALDWSREFRVVDEPITSVPGFAVMDRLNLGDRASERDHRQTISFVSFSPEALGSINGVDIRSRGISHDGSVQESFQMATAPGHDIDLILRYRSDALPGLPEPSAIVRANGFEVGELALDAGLGVLAETTLRVPGALIAEETARFDIEWDGFVTEFRWWTVDAGESEGGALPGGVGGLLVGAGPPEGAIAFDGFSAPDGAPPDLRVPDTIRHGGWWVEVDDTAEFTFRDARLVEESLDDTADHHLVIDARVADVSVRADVEWTGSSAGLVIRHSGAGRRNMVFAWYDGKGKQVHLAKIVNGSFTLVASTDRDWGAAGTVRHFELSASGSQVRVLVDGVNVVSAQIPELAGNTFAGVFTRGETVTRWDNFSLTPTGAPAEGQ